MTNPSITLCMIVKNEEKYLEKCLSSIQEIINEIIIVDTGSTDLTINIANKYKAKVYNTKWNNNFSEARNISINYATSDYILVLDADEYIEDTKQILKDLNLLKDYYICRIKNYSESGFVRYHEAVRLFKNNIGLEYFGRIHEHLNIQNNTREYDWSYSKAQIGHIGYREDVIKEKDKKNRNLNLLLKALEENPSGYDYFNLAKQYKQINNIPQAITYFKKAYTHSKNMNYLNELLFHIADCLRQQERYEDALTVLEDAINTFPTYTDLHFVHGRVFLEYGYYEEAKHAFDKCISLGEMSHSSTTEGVGSFWAYFYLSEVEIYLGNKLKALEALFYSIKLKKHFDKAITSYIKLMVTAKIELDEVFQSFNQLYVINNQEDLIFIIKLLYQSRSPLLQKYLEKYNIQLDDRIQSISYEYARKYEYSVEIWKENKKVCKENIIDLVLLSMILKDDSLLKNSVIESKLEYEEVNSVYKMVEPREYKNVEFNLYKEKIIIDLIEKLIVLEQFEIFYLLSRYFSSCSLKGQLVIAKILSEYGYINQAMELAFKVLQKDEQNAEVTEFLGDLYFKDNCLEEALVQYKRLLQFNSQYRVYRKIYKIYELLQNLEGLNEIREIISRKYRFSNLNIKYGGKL
ncbi:glycosyltransferase [Priestia sp. TRN 1309]|uniref:glycosyltransferase n=1 Tax=Priestia sp. TRN 1309 TaxID=3420729 RepID=UPI003D76F1E3